MTVPYVHLHTHSAYSLAEGAIPVSMLGELCRTHKMPAIAVTDTNNLFGALEASEAFSSKGVQSITGVELRVVIGDEPARTSDGRLASVVLLAQNDAGYRRLMYLTSQAFLSPAAEDEVSVSLDMVLAETDGIICLSGGPQGPLDRLAMTDRAEESAALCAKLASAFPGRFYLELQRHPGGEGTDRRGRYRSEGFLLEQAFEQELPVVATNNVYFQYQEDHAAHDALLCIADGKYISQSERRQLPDGHFFTSPEVMAERFADLPEALEATVEIAERCAFRPRMHAPMLPSFAGDLEGEIKALEQMASDGLRQRLTEIELAAGEQAYWDRLRMELDIINRMEFPGYFLIVADFIQWAKGKGIPVGPGRGSGAGSLVAYALTITDLDPLRFNLLFERFLNPERVSMPDFDIDFCQDRRDEVIAYVQDRYGADRVAQIITFGKLQARAVLRDVGRVLQMPFGQVDRLCKLVPNNPANPVTLDEAIRGEPRFKIEQENDERVGSLLDTALKLEGLYRHASTHAAGVVIGKRPLHEDVPLYRDPRSPMPATQFNMKWVEPAGLVKFDFLGLKTLTVIQRALDYLTASDIHVDIAKIPLDDATTYEMLGKGDAVGVFQLESAGMRATLKGLHADCLEDIIALVSLYRPGPMDNIPTYIDRKAGREEPDYLHPLLTEVLRETYGVIIYQEQVMQIAQILAGYSLGEADLLRRAMGKKKKEEMDKQRIRFVQGAKERDVDPAKAEGIFDLVAKFAGYGFNKSHAAAYAWVSYQTAYLKANYPAAFLAASMSLDSALTDKLAVFVSEARRCKVVVHPPSINASNADFKAVPGEITYALGAIKNVGSEAMAVIEAERAAGGPFDDLLSFFERIDARRIGRRGIEQLARAGAFDCVEPNRAHVHQNADFLLKYSAACADEKKSSQGGLFAEEAGTKLARPNLPAVTPWTTSVQLEEERGALGFYLTGHPLDDYSELLAQKNVTPSSAIASVVADSGGMQSLTIAGVVRDVSRRRSKSGKPFGWITLSDQVGELEVTAFSEVLDSLEGHLEPGVKLVMRITAEEREGALRMTAEGGQPLEALERSQRAASICVALDNDHALGAIKERLANLNGDGGGRCELVLFLPASHVGMEVEMTVPIPVPATAATKAALKTIPGVVDVRLA